MFECRNYWFGSWGKAYNGYNNHPNCKVTKICDFDLRKLKDVSSRFPDIDTTINPLEILNDEQN